VIVRAEHQRLVVGRRLAARAPHQCAQARQQHARLDRLIEEIIGALFQAGHFIVRIFARGQDQDRHVADGAQLAAHHHAVEAGQHQVQHHDVGGDVGEARHGLVAARDQLHGEFIAVQIFHHKRRETGVVLHKHDSIHGSLLRRVLYKFHHAGGHIDTVSRQSKTGRTGRE
jgi:hypothetical protein